MRALIDISIYITNTPQLRALMKQMLKGGDPSSALVIRLAVLGLSCFFNKLCLFISRGEYFTS
jgi:hypothetical protein